MKILKTDMYLLLIDEKTKIGDNNYFINVIQKEVYRNNIENYNVNKDYLKLIIAYYPLTKEAKELDLPLLPDPFKGKIDTNVQTRNFNKQVKNPYSNYDKEYQIWERAYIEGFDDGVSQDKQFSLEDMKTFAKKCLIVANETEGIGRVDKFIDEMSKSLSTQQLPKEFVISDKFSTFEENIKNGKYKW